MKAIIFGATGLVGSELVKTLTGSTHYEIIYLVARNKDKVDRITKSLNSSGLETLIYKDFGQISDIEVDHCYICLGTTIRDAGSKKAFKYVDLTLVLNALKKAKSLGAKKSCIISAIGSDINSPFFYSRVKAQMEREAKLIDEAVCFVKPSLLLGKREKSRFLEDIGQAIIPKINFLFKGPLKQYKPISARDVALEMIEKTCNA